MGSIASPAGAGSFRFGVATAATQIEDMNETVDWYLWGLPLAEGGLGKGTFVDQATQGYTRVNEDLDLVKGMGLDSYRFSIEWARIEPQRDVIDMAAVAHYRAQLERMRDLGIKPMVTLHHFSNPIWVADPSDGECTRGVSDTNLCGIGSAGGAQVVEEMAEHARFMAEQFGDLVDEWCTLNEPVNYLVAGYLLAQFPPGRFTFTDLSVKFIPVMRDYIAAHAAMYDAIKAGDTVDADGDSRPADVGLAMSVADWTAARAGTFSTLAEDLQGREKFVYVFHWLFVDALTQGGFDTDFDGGLDEPHPEWANTLDWLGLQYYFRAGVTAETVLIPEIGVTPCFGPFDNGACIRPPDPTYCVPRMGYEGWIDGFGRIIQEYSARYPTLPFVVTESGIATEVGRRRAENVVRILEVIARERAAGADVRGYYHWSLTDNFEWAEGFIPRFGLYQVDYTSYDRTPTEGADVLRAIATERELTGEQRTTYGGTGPLTVEPGFDNVGTCVKFTD